MISNEFQQVNINNEIYIRTQMPGYSLIDSDISNFMLTNADMFIPCNITNAEPDVLYYNIQNYVSLGEQMMQPTNKKKLLMIFDNILHVVEMLKNAGISFANIMWNWNYIYIDSNSESEQVKFLLLPIDLHLTNDYGEPVNLIRNILATNKYDLTENCHYVAQLITIINEYKSPMELMNNFSALVRELMNETVMKHKKESVKKHQQKSNNSNSGFDIEKTSWESLINNTSCVDETSLDDKKPIACLERIKTGENIQIVGDMFKIGKDPSVVDYVISDNSAVSRFHAKIHNKSGAYYIEDNDSTNKTYVDGKMLTPNEQMLLIKGMIINIAGEEFKYNII